MPDRLRTGWRGWSGSEPTSAADGLAPRRVFGFGEVVDLVEHVQSAGVFGPTDQRVGDQRALGEDLVGVDDTEEPAVRCSR